MPRQDDNRTIAATHPRSESLAALAALRNLGPVSARWLYDAGITSPAALRRAGAIAAFRQVALHRGGDVSVNLLNALDGALRGEHWDHLPRRVRERLRAAVDWPTPDRDKPSPSSRANAAASSGDQVGAYFAAVSPDVRRGLRTLRDAIRSAAPGAVEGYSYGMPAFTLEGRPLVWYAAWKKHYGLYPIGAAIVRSYAADLEKYATAKGTVRFLLSQPLPSGLVRRIVRARVEELNHEASV